MIHASKSRCRCSRLTSHSGRRSISADRACWQQWPASLYVSWNGPQLISAATRLQGIFFSGFLHLSSRGPRISRHRPPGKNHSRARFQFPVQDLVVATLLTTAIIIAARFIWFFPATYLPRWLSPALARRDPSPPWQTPFIVSFIGVRGVVSLAAALAIPFTVTSGAPFPHRDLILLITFGVIILTLVGQGLMLPSVIRWLRPGRQLRQRTSRGAPGRTHRAPRRHPGRPSPAGRARKERQLPEQVFGLLRARHEVRAGLAPRDLQRGKEAVTLSAELRVELIATERAALHELYRKGRSPTSHAAVSSASLILRKRVSRAGKMRRRRRPSATVPCS